MDCVSVNAGRHKGASASVGVETFIRLKDGCDRLGWGIASSSRDWDRLWEQARRSAHDAEGFLLVVTPVRALFVAGLRKILAQSRPCVPEDRFFHIWPVK